MTPVYLNPPPSSAFPLVELKEDQHHLQLLLSPPHNHQPPASSLSSASPSSSASPFFNASDQDQRAGTLGKSHQNDHNEVEKYISLGRSSDHKIFSSFPFQNVLNNGTGHIDVPELSSCKREDGDIGGSGEGSGKWMPSKMRLMRKMMNSSNLSSPETDNSKPKFSFKFQSQQQQTKEINNNNHSIRVCADCNTTTTPLWRSGPRGPKSLCNACGIRQRKARQAMVAAAAAANGTVLAMEASSSSSTKTLKGHNKEKKPRIQCKKVCKPPDHHHHHHHNNQQNKKICFKNLALSLSKNSSALQSVFISRDVEEAAVLLMELSCGFIHS